MLSLAVSALIPERVKWTWSGESLVPEIPSQGLRSLRAQDAETMQTGNAHRQWVCKVCLEETDPCVAITKSGVSATANERSHRMSVIKRKEDEIQKL